MYSLFIGIKHDVQGCSYENLGSWFYVDCDDEEIVGSGVKLGIGESGKFYLLGFGEQPGFVIKTEKENMLQRFWNWLKNIFS